MCVRERVCVCVFEKDDSVCERECVGVLFCERERERESEG